MAVLIALRRTLDTLQRNPVLFVPVLAIVLLYAPQLVLRSISPGLALLFSLVLSVAYVFVLPFVQGGLVGMADEALDGSTSLATFRSAGGRNYVSLLVVSIVFVVINIITGVFVLFAGFVAIFARYPGGAGDTTALVAFILVVLAIVALGYLLFVFFVQFYAQAIVVDRRGALDALRRSGALVRAHFVSVFGYSIGVGLLGGLVGVVFAISSMIVTPGAATSFGLPQLSLAGVAGISLVVVAIGTLLGSFFGVFSVAFYRTMAE